MLDLRRRQRTLVSASVWVCFFLSGAAGLVYEIVWMRMLGLVFGHTVFAVTTVLAAFMAGLALGSFLVGRLIDRRGRPLQVYGVLEAGIGAYALLVPLLLTQVQFVYLALHGSLKLSSVAFSLTQFALVFLILLVPTTLMGASLPVLAKFLVNRAETLGRKVGDLYALNTLGAVVGSVAAGFFLLPAIGTGATIGLAAAANLGIGAWALMLARWLGESSVAPVSSTPVPVDHPTAQSAEPIPLQTWLVLAGTGLSGAAAMVYELAWTRSLSLVIGSSVYAFSAMLTTFLVGLALGSFLFARIWGRRQVDAALFGTLEVAIGFIALALTPAFGRLPDLVLAILTRTTPSSGGALLAQFASSFLVMIIPTTIIGATFPCAVQICSGTLTRLGRDVGRVYSANTVGTIAGALLAGFLLVPWLGARASMVVGAAVNTAIGLTVLAAAGPARPLWRRAAIAPLAVLFLAGVMFLPRWDPRVMAGGVSIYVERFTAAADPAALFRETAAARQLLFYREGINSTVAVERTEQMISLRVDGKVDASNGPDMATQLMLGHLPLLLHPNPERVLIIGLGSGVTVGAVAQHTVVREIDVVELEPAVVEASSFFIEENRNALRDPRVRLVLGDGRNYVLASKKRYDVISSEPSNPWMAGVANLFSREFYRLARARLADDGIMIQWVQGYSLFPEDLKMIVKTFRQSFPHATLWRTLRGDYLLVGTPSPLRIDYALLKRRSAASSGVREDMASLWFATPLDVLTLFFLDEADLGSFARGAPVNSDDRPLLEFRAPLALYRKTTDENQRLLRETRTTELPPIDDLPAGVLESRRVHFARIFWAGGEREEALDQLRKASSEESRDVVSQLDRAKLLFSLGEFAEATEKLASLARGGPQDRVISSYLKAGAILRELKAEGAVSEHGRTRLGDANPAEAHNNLGVFYTRMGIRSGEPAFFELAVDSIEAALRIEPQAYAALNNLGNAYFELRRLEEAAQAYRRALTLKADLPQSHFNLGLVYEQQGARDAAVREYRLAIILQPSWDLPRLNLQRLGASSIPEKR
jgi:spermidine synthase